MMASTPITSSRPDRPHASTLGEATRLLADVARRGDVGRWIGGVAVALRCESARARGPFARDYSDLDMVTSRSSATGLAAVLSEHGYVPVRNFNALHGRTRMLFVREDGAHADVFIDTFSMCHRLELAQRLSIHEETVSLADLLLTKLQVAKINHKDVTDALALLVDHELSSDESGINISYIAEILAKDWGWWRTMTANLEAIRTRLPRMQLPPLHAEISGSRLAQLSREIELRPKSMRWRMRARMGDRIPWREDPEEVGP